MQEYDFPENAWVGTTINTDKDRARVEILRKVRARGHYISIEPLLGPVTVDLKGIEWMIVGAKTGAVAEKEIPKAEWIEEILGQAKRRHIPVFMKKNLSKYYPGNTLREFPLGDR